VRARYVVFAVSAVVAAAIACGIVYSRAKPRQAAPRAMQQAPAPAAELGFPVTVRARHVVPIPAPVDGTLDEVLVNANEPVYEGQVIARIRNTMLESEREAAVRDLQAATERLEQMESELADRRLESSRASADSARVQLEFKGIEKGYLRQQMLYREGATPRLVFEKVEKEYLAKRAERDTAFDLARSAADRLDAAQKRYEALRSEREVRSRELDEANANAAAGEVRSPVTGVLLGITRRAGEPVPPGLPDLARVAVNLAELEAVVEPPPGALPAFRPGVAAMLVFAEYPDAIPGKVREVAGRQVVIDFVTPVPAIIPGAHGQARLAAQ